MEGNPNKPRSRALQVGHPSAHSADTGSSTLPQHEQNPQWGLGVNSFLVLPQSPREFNAEERAAGLLPRRSDCRARTRPILANRPFHGGATTLNKSCPRWPLALPAALPAWHRAKPLNKGGLEAEHTLTPWWISLDRPRRGASPTPPWQSLGWQCWQHVALAHQGSCSDGVTSSCLDPRRPQDTTPAIFQRQPTSAGDLLDTDYSQAVSAR